jgi:tetratricopeptide (TPR) repeat protein
MKKGLLGLLGIAYLASHEEKKVQKKLDTIAKAKQIVNAVPIKFEQKDYSGVLSDIDMLFNKYGDVLDSLEYEHIANLYYIRGRAKLYLNDYESAIDDYTNALKYRQNFRDALAFRSETKFKMRDFAGVIDDTTIIINLAPEPDAFGERAAAKYEIKDYTGAIEDYTQAINLNPNFAKAYMNRGAAKFDDKDVKGAKEDYLKAIELNSLKPPFNAWIY